MARANYDDWNIEAGSREIRHLDERLNSFVFILCLLIFVITSLVNMYSITYPIAVVNGLSSHFYVARFAIYVCFACVIGVFVLFTPKNVLKGAMTLLSLVCSAGLWVNVLLPVPVIPDEAIYNLVFSCTGCYIAIYFGRKSNCLDELKFLTVPVFVSIVTFWGILANGNLTFAVLYMIFMSFMFLQGGTGLKGLFILLAYLAVPLACWIFTNQDNMNKLFTFFLNSGVSSDFQRGLRLECIGSAGVQGTGIGLGLLKSSSIQGLTDVYVLCNLIDETGYIGISLICIAFLSMLVCCFRAGYSLSGTDCEGANIVRTLGVLIVSQFVINFIQLFDLLSVKGVTCPFYSYSVTVVLNILGCFVIYRLMHSDGGALKRRSKSKESEEHSYKGGSDEDFTG